MARLCQEKRNRKTHFRIYLTPIRKGERPSIWVGDVTRRFANQFLNNVAELEYARDFGCRPEPRVVNWLTTIPYGLFDKLAKHGLCQGLPTASPIRLGEFLDQYVASRTDVKAATRKKYDFATRQLTTFFGQSRLLSEITQGDADDWQSSLGGHYARATVSRVTRHARQMFAYAIRKNYLPENPFEHLPIAGEVNHDRWHFVEREVVEQVMEQAPLHWKRIIALARYGAFRCPSEIQKLRHCDISLERKEIVIRGKSSGKDGVRICPLFPELRSFLRSANGSSELFVPASLIPTNPRTEFRRLIERAGITPWPKLFHNLRASRKVELSRELPDYLVAAWTGTSVAVDRKHYLRPADADLIRATA